MSAAESNEGGYVIETPGAAEFLRSEECIYWQTGWSVDRLTGKLYYNGQEVVDKKVPGAAASLPLRMWGDV